MKLAFMAFFTFISAGKTYGCPGSAWSPYKNNCFLFMKTGTTWKNARTFCQQQSAKSDLASIADENEQNFVYSKLPSKLVFTL